MSKFYYLSPDESQGDTPLREDIWFERYQHILVSLANTVEGRALLLIDDRHIPVVEVRKNFVRYDIGGGMYIADFRVGAKWANVIRYRWQEVKKAYDRMILKSILGYPPIYSHDGRLLHPVGGGLTLTVYPDPHPESTTVDGTIKTTPTIGTWDSHHDASTGVSVDDSSGDLSISTVTHNHGWYYFRRGMTLFDTSVITAAGIISAAIWSGVMTGATYNFSGSLALVGATPANNDRLITADFNQFDTTIRAATQAISSFDVGGTNYNPFTLNSDGETLIDQAGITKIGIRIENDRADNEPSLASDAADRVLIETAETTGTSKDPKLVITYTISFTPKLIMF